ARSRTRPNQPTLANLRQLTPAPKTGTALANGGLNRLGLLEHNRPKSRRKGMLPTSMVLGPSMDSFKWEDYWRCPIWDLSFQQLMTGAVFPALRTLCTAVMD
ncbi:hypothetical protein BVRB_022820, partial [Beta vulgaris subsp. vulgaris]